MTGVPDPLRGEVIAAFVMLRPGLEGSEEIDQSIRNTVRRELGPIAVIGSIEFVALLPKTRSGKIMRRVLRSVVRNENPGDVSTIEEPRGGPVCWKLGSMTTPRLRNQCPGREFLRIKVTAPGQHPLFGGVLTVYV